MDSRRPVDVLPDHTADTFADWLRQHPHIGTVCRDRGGAFAEGAERGQPGISQVADRWHLLHNLATGLEKTVTRHRSCLKVSQPDSEQSTAPARTSGEETPYERKIRERHRDVHELFQRGLTIDAISARLGLDRKTVRRYARAATAESLMRERPSRSSALTPHKPYLARRWAEGCDNAQTLRDEIAARGYQGCRKSGPPLPQHPGPAQRPSSGSSPTARGRRCRAMDHRPPGEPERPGPPGPQGRLRTLPGDRRSLPPGPGLRHHPPPSRRAPPWRLAHPGRCVPGQGDSHLRQRATQGPRRRHRGPHPAPELRCRGGQRHGNQVPQTPALRPGRLRPTPQTHPPRPLSAPHHCLPSPLSTAPRAAA
ncbi:putative transposase for insertion sequence element [Streptomyces bingchenggensis BCW-1]|uniref:Putative transposase for insertion sequence element n=1 Tax=Streptomyces bingchenggensis (strain BCW-1) TaxID=749414 RepID=D7CDF4_STRBB|nr:putative transposase for insertion sequence element [Streptomyces bingchenggensis BCW-1]